MKGHLTPWLIIFALLHLAIKFYPSLNKSHLFTIKILEVLGLTIFTIQLSRTEKFKITQIANSGQNYVKISYDKERNLTVMKLAVSAFYSKIRMTMRIMKNILI